MYMYLAILAEGKLFYFCAENLQVWKTSSDSNLKHTGATALPPFPTPSLNQCNISAQKACTADKILNSANNGQLLPTHRLLQKYNTDETL